MNRVPESSGDAMRLPAGLELKRLMDGPPLLTLGIAESLTSGQVQARVGSVSGASTFFRGGLTAYTIEQKVRHLGVDRAPAEACEAVSEDVARQMARGTCRLFACDVALAITGYAEIPPAGAGPRPFAWWALSHRQSHGGWHDLSGRFPASAGSPRTDVQHQFADAIIHELIRYLRDIRRPGGSG
jgi:nicotinamide-nucleotide amidase